MPTKTCPFCKAISETKEPSLIWKTPSFKESFGTHWTHLVFLKEQPEMPRFKVWCPYGEKVQTFVQDLETNEIIEYGGSNAEAGKIIAKMLSSK